MADVPGACELPLTRAVVQYRDVHEVDTPGGRIRDIGLALVLEGRYASSAEVVDLGSAHLKVLDLSHELVVLDWAYEPTLEHITGLVRAVAEGGDRGDLERFCFQVGLQVLERVGFSPLTRPSLLRLGFRDVCRDLDLHDGTSVRIRLGGGRMCRVHMDYDGNALAVRTATAARDGALEEALAAAFPDGDVRRIVPASEAAVGGYQVRFSLPQSLDELRQEMALVRGGILRLLTRFEPGRVQDLESVLSTFGERETLARLRPGRGESRAERVSVRVPSAGTVH
ncbi:MAG TPA: hypothetical protein VLA43_03705 [Longimicrobiales bacterium]|nr:hypothetical protein [Longimicrobiales bacterium]